MIMDSPRDARFDEQRGGVAIIPTARHDRKSALAGRIEALAPFSIALILDDTMGLYRKIAAEMSLPRDRIASRA